MYNAPVMGSQESNPNSAVCEMLGRDALQHSVVQCENWVAVVGRECPRSVDCPPSMPPDQCSGERPHPQTRAVNMTPMHQLASCRLG